MATIEQGAGCAHEFDWKTDPEFEIDKGRCKRCGQRAIRNTRSSPPQEVLLLEDAEHPTPPSRVSAFSGGATKPPIFSLDRPKF